MDLRLSHVAQQDDREIQITGSKSESNRLLILQALFPQITIKNLSNSDDTRVMQKALRTQEKLINIGHAGTAMRFLTAYFSTCEGREVLLTGSKRMKERPIGILVDALRQLGAAISYEENEGFPPLRIKGKKLERDTVAMTANVSSQYLSALMLIASQQPKGLKIQQESELTSVPYLKMTAALLEAIGIETVFSKDDIRVFSKKEIQPVSMLVESDWSSASYFYSSVALGNLKELRLNSYRASSLQGDRAVADIYRQLGVETVFSENRLILKKQACHTQSITLDLSDTPDIAQTIAVTCLGLKIPCQLTGLHTLKIKETDRLVGLKTEMEKLGASVGITADSLVLSPSETLSENVEIETYDDHRMAMAFAPLALKVPLIIKDAGVVSKSYPDFWKDLRKLGFQCQTIVL